MLVASLPYDYVQQITRGDRVRRSCKRAGGSRVRRGALGAAA